MPNELNIPEPINPKKVFDDLMKRCKSAKRWEIRCMLDEAWVGVAPFDMAIIDGIFHCYPIAPTLREAYVMVSDKLPVIAFLDYKDNNGS
jgi:hypothetical protein